MNEINLNPSSRPVGIEKHTNVGTSQKAANVRNPSLEADSTQFSQVPDFSSIEETLEKEFAGLRSSLAQSVESPNYPPLDAIDRLAAMLALNLDQNRGSSAK